MIFITLLPRKPYGMADAKLAAIVVSCTTVFTLLINVGFNFAVTCVTSKYRENVR